MVQAQREFIADASHELPHPLTSILANLELLHDRLEADRPEGEESEMVDSALRSSRRMRRLVADLLMLARADAGRFGERSRATSPRSRRPPWTRSARSPTGTTSRRGTGPVPVLANPDELHRLTLNLLDNAVRHTPAGSSDRGRPSHGATAVLLEVADDGPGLPGRDGGAGLLAVRPRRRPGRPGGRLGTGLGLAIVRAVAVSHGGDVPRATGPPAAPASRSPAARRRFRRGS